MSGVTPTPTATPGPVAAVLVNGRVCSRGSAASRSSACSNGGICSDSGARTCDQATRVVAPTSRIDVGTSHVWWRSREVAVDQLNPSRRGGPRYQLAGRRARHGGDEPQKARGPGQAGQPGQQEQAPALQTVRHAQWEAGPCWKRSVTLLIMHGDGYARGHVTTGVLVGGHMPDWPRQTRQVGRICANGLARSTRSGRRRQPDGPNGRDKQPLRGIGDSHKREGR